MRTADISFAFPERDLQWLCERDDRYYSCGTAQELHLFPFSPSAACRSRLVRRHWKTLMYLPEQINAPTLKNTYVSSAAEGTCNRL